MIYSTVVCRTPLLQSTLSFKETVGNQNGVPEPGETLSAEVELRNVKSQTLKNILAEAKVTNGKEYVTLPSAYLAWDDIAPGDSAKSLSPLEVQISPTAMCGTPIALGLSLSTSAGAQELSENFRLGKFNGAPVVQTASDLILPIGGAGQTVTMPIQFTTSSAKPLPRKVQFMFRAKVAGQRYVKFTLSSPNKEVLKVISEGNASGEFVYDKDVTALFGKAGTLGDWTLEAKVNGKEEEGTLLAYKLLVFPDSYLCER